MPKHEPGSAKALSNRMKSVGLQKLRWYCQMCQKQCRDENGFKCHTASEGHLRQMRLFAENPNHIMDDFSREFERGYLETLSHRHSTKRVKANAVYQEYIADKHHIHMNATIWTSLTEFVIYLGREGKAVVDETEKGWFVQFIDRDPKLLARQAAAAQRQRVELDDEERKKREIQAQVQAAAAAVAASDEAAAAADNFLMRDDADEKVAVDLKAAIKAPLGQLGKKRPRVAVASTFAVDDDDDDDEGAGDSDAAKNSTAEGDKVAASGDALHNRSNGSGNGSTRAGGGGVVAQLMREDEQRRQHQRPPSQRDEAPAADSRRHSEGATAGSGAGSGAGSDAGERKDYWLKRGIIVKIASKRIDRGRCYKEKAEVIRLLGKYEAEVELLSDGKRIEVHQDDVETVVPKVGQPLLVVNGRGRGCQGIMLRINEKHYNCDIRITDCSRASNSSDAATLQRGQELLGLEYEDICKLIT